jgi:hypothetical protein
VESGARSFSSFSIVILNIESKIGLGQLSPPFYPTHPIVLWNWRDNVGSIILIGVVVIQLRCNFETSGSKYLSTPQLSAKSPSLSKDDQLSSIRSFCVHQDNARKDLRTKLAQAMSSLPHANARQVLPFIVHTVSLKFTSNRHRRHHLAFFSPPSLLLGSKL